MKIGWKKIDGKLKDAVDLSKQYNKTVIGRVLASSDGQGWDQINLCTLPLNVNLLWLGGDKSEIMPLDTQGYKPSIVKEEDTEMWQYRLNYSKFYQQLTGNIFLASVQNEAVSWNANYSPSTMAKMVKFHATNLPDSLISHSGTSMILWAGMTQQYLIDTKQDDKLATYRAQWAKAVLGFPEHDKVKLALDEIKAINRLNIPNFIYTVHFNGRETTLPCIPVMMEALRYYTSYPVAVNELSLYSYSTPLVTALMKAFRKEDVSIVLGFCGPKYWALQWTDEQIAAYMAFGS